MFIQYTSVWAYSSALKHMQPKSSFNNFSKSFLLSPEKTNSFRINWKGVMYQVLSNIIQEIIESFWASNAFWRDSAVTWRDQYLKLLRIIKHLNPSSRKRSQASRRKGALIHWDNIEFTFNLKPDTINFLEDTCQKPWILLNQRRNIQYR